MEQHLRFNCSRKDSYLLKIHYAFTLCEFEANQESTIINKAIIEQLLMIKLFNELDKDKYINDENKYSVLINSALYKNFFKKNLKCNDNSNLRAIIQLCDNCYRRGITHEVANNVPELMDTKEEMINIKVVNNVAEILTPHDEKVFFFFDL